MFSPKYNCCCRYYYYYCVYNCLKFLRPEHVYCAGEQAIFLSFFLHSVAAIKSSPQIQSFFLWEEAVFVNSTRSEKQSKAFFSQSNFLAIWIEPTDGRRRRRSLSEAWEMTAVVTRSSKKKETRAEERESVSNCVDLGVVVIPSFSLTFTFFANQRTFEPTTAATFNRQQKKILPKAIEIEFSNFPPSEKCIFFLPFFAQGNNLGGNAKKITQSSS